MLHRSFKAAKCKTALQMASSRLKILKNKKYIQIKQLKSELAELLESGQNQTAGIRVEHVVREEKTMAAYELIGIYCELLVARMAVIESQKKCPTDLKEAVASVVFASRRCADIPELVDALKHFTAKYGKDFVSAAVEVRPDCGVSRLLIEKLSAKAPSGPTKIKILSLIAEEHNIKWEPKSFGESDSKPPEGLLRGPNTFEASSELHLYPPRVQDKEEPSHVQAPRVINVPPRSTEKLDIPVNTYGHHGRSPSHPQNIACSSTSVNKTSCHFIHPNMRHSEADTGEMEYGHQYFGDENLSPMSRHRWNTEFKDATAAAQAAAESAERASMAARAAAELSSKERIMRQDSTGSQNASSSFGLRNESAQRYGGSKLQCEHLAEDQPNNPPPGRNFKMQDEDVSSNTHNNPSVECSKDGEQKNDKSSSAETSKSMNEEPLEDYLQTSGRFSQKSSSGMWQSDSFSKSGAKEQSSESDIHIGYPEEIWMRKQSSHASSRSHSSTFSEEHSVGSDFNSQRSQADLEENIFATNDRERLRSSTKEVESDDDHAAHFDDYSSFFDKPKFDAEDAHEQECGLGFGLLGKKSPHRGFTKINSWSFAENQGSRETYSSQSHFFTENSPVLDEGSTSSAVHLHLDNSSTAKYDDYSQESESEEEREKAEAAGGNSSRFPVTQEVEEEFFPSEPDEPMEDSRTFEEASLESQTELNFRTLTGGLRNKGRRLPPYTKSPSSKITSKQDDECTSTVPFSSSAAKSLISFGASSKELHNEKMNTEAKKILSSDPSDPPSSDDDFKGELPRQTTSKNQERFGKQTSIEDNKTSNSKIPVSYLPSLSSDEEEEVSRNTSSGSARPNIGFSRRTKPQPKAPERSSFSKTTVSSEPPVTLKHVEEGSMSISSYDTKTQPKPPCHDQESFRSSLESMRPSAEEYSKSLAKPQAFGSLPKVATSDSTQSSNTSSVETPSKVKATHVHPKLPDYDDLFVKFESLRSNRL